MCAATTPGWSRLVVLASGLLNGEIKQSFCVASHPMRRTEPLELVKVHLNADRVLAAPHPLAVLLRDELEPFIIGVGKVRADFTPEGIVVLSADDRDGKCRCHCDPPDITPEMIEAGAREVLRFNRDFESEDSAAHRIYMAMRVRGADIRDA
jgi:hypothetical protein